MLSERALKVVSDFVLRKVPEGKFKVRFSCACSKRLDVRSLEELVEILNDVFENFGNVIEDWEVEMIEQWLKPYGVVIEKKEGYRAKILRSGYEDKVEEVFDYYSCGMKEGALILAKSVLDSIARDRGFKNFKDLPKGNPNDILNKFYDLLGEDLSEEEKVFVLKTFKNVVDLCSSPQA